MYYAYAAFGALDANSKPVIDPQTGKQIETGVCMIWRSNYVTDNPGVSILVSNFYSKYSYRVNKSAKQLTVYQVEGSTSGGDHFWDWLVSSRRFHGCVNHSNSAALHAATT